MIQGNQMTRSCLTTLQALHNESLQLSDTEQEMSADQELFSGDYNTFSLPSTSLTREMLKRDRTKLHTTIKHAARPERGLGPRIPPPPNAIHPRPQLRFRGEHKTVWRGPAAS